MAMPAGVADYYPLIHYQTIQTMLLHALLCLVPLLKLGFGAVFYRLLAAIAQPVSDRRMVDSVGSVGEGLGLLMKVLLMVGALFFISIAMAAASIGS